MILAIREKSKILHSLLNSDGISNLFCIAGCDNYSYLQQLQRILLSIKTVLQTFKTSNNQGLKDLVDKLLDLVDDLIIYYDDMLNDLQATCEGKIKKFHA